MAADYVQSTKKFYTGASTTLAFPSNVSAGSLLVVTLHNYGGNENGASVTDSMSHTYTKLFWTGGGDGSLVLALYYYWNTAAGACTVTVNCGATGTYTSISIAEYSGILTTGDPKDGTGFDTNTGTSTSVSGGPITPSQSGDLLIGLMTSMAGGQVSIAPDADYVQIQEYENGANEMHMNVMYRIYGSTSADTANWTLGSSQGWIGGVAAFKAAVYSMLPDTINKRNQHLFVR